jgi:hypothetical protein
MSSARQRPDRIRHRLLDEGCRPPPLDRLSCFYRRDQIYRSNPATWTSKLRDLPARCREQVAEICSKRHRATGVPLRITSEAVTDDDDTRDTRCKLCGALSNKNLVSLKDMAALVCDNCMYESHEQTARSRSQQAIRLCLRRAGLAFRRHFAGSVGFDLAAVPKSYAR